MNELQHKENRYDRLIADIGALMFEARRKVASSVNTVMVDTYWHVGKYIVEYEQGGNEKAEYGSELLNRLSHDLRMRYGKGFSRSNVYNMRRLYVLFPKVQTLSGKSQSSIKPTLSLNISWSHYLELLKLNDPIEISFYMHEAENERWSVRELKRQMSSMLFHRLAVTKDKNGVLELARKGNEVVKPEDIIKDPYVLEFAGLSDEAAYNEGDLEDALINHLGRFLLELGKGFAFIGRQYRFSIAGRHYYVDLVFYHAILKTYVLIDLKRGMVQPEHVGQMNFYLNYFKSEVCTEGDNAPIGILLGGNADELTLEYALNGIPNQLFVSRYQLYLPDRETLEKEVRKVLGQDKKDRY